MAKYIAKIKEVGHIGVLTSSLDCEKKSKQELIAFWGLEEPDVEWYQLFEVITGKEVQL